MKTLQFQALSTVIVGDSPPSEFLLFKEGSNSTRKGVFLFDEKAAADVMADYQVHGTDLMIDYVHASINAAYAPDPALAGKAAGWFGLALRGGDLWAVNVRWTEPAALALTRKEYRYTSPAFSHDEDGRITSILNVAITNIPATDDLKPLMAASKAGVVMADGATKGGMTLDEMIKVAKALGLDPNTTSVADIMAKLAGGGPAPAAAPADKPADSATDASAAPAAPPAKKDDAAPAADGDAPPSSSKMKAASRVACAITGKDDPTEAVAELSRGYRVGVDLEARETKLAADRAALESGERRGLVASLVKLGCETPATAWSDDKGTVPCKRLASEPIAELRERVKKLSAAKPTPPVAKPPVGSDSPDGEKSFATPHGEVTLSGRELRFCAETGAKPEVYAANKGFMAAQGRKG